ncbi:MAG: fibronectin type III domain-containing protein, partial [Candidatus Syntrophosphaera sp.]|nr:fibronectin type III domain-containing protein [Candidatus Syntrophosphaera sp.]
MTRSLFLLASLAVLLVASGNAVVTEIGSIRGFLYGTEPASSYDHWVSHLAEGRVSYLNVYAPWEQQNNDFGDFHIATSEELQNWGLVIDAFLALDLQEAQSKLEQFGFPFEVVQFQDLDSGRLLYLIRELLNEDIDTNGSSDPNDHEIGSFDYGWGLYIYDPSAYRPVVITAPHPCDDFPSPVFALEAFLKLDARFLLINGAGREVAYFPPYNSNNQSISDPSRLADHPFNVAYQRFCDQIRGLTDKTEFSLQIHSYDWNKYPGQPNVMLSAGNFRHAPALPIRDNSRARHDLLNHTPFLIHPQNTIGTHAEVDILDYYCVYHAGDPVYYDNEGQLIPIANNHDLPGAQYNQQMLYTTVQNIYDVYSPFLHVEMDELAKCYVRNEDNLHWFYGYDAATESWNLADRYTRFIQFYTPWLDALHTVIDSMLVLDDGTGPSNPENLRLTAVGAFHISFAWERSYSYDFDSYIIYLRWEEDGAWIEQVLDRNTNPDLAWQNTSSYILWLDSGRVYYLRVQARDKQGNHSLMSNELKVWKMGTGLGNFAAAAGDGAINLSFGSQLTEIQGFSIFRKDGSGEWFCLASWTHDPALQPNAEGTYAYQDNTVSNGVIYSYQVSTDFGPGNQVFHWYVLRASPYRKYPFVLSCPEYELSKTFWLGLNPLASDGSDPLDLYQPDSAPLQIGTMLSSDDTICYQDIRQPFDAAASSKVWALNYRSDHPSAYLVLTPDPNLLLEGAELLLFDVERNHWHDLRLGPYVWMGPSHTGWQNLELHWGRQLPRAQFPPADDVFQWLGGTLDLNWQVINRPRVASVDLYLCGSQDS